MTYRPTPALTVHSPNLIHSSTRTRLCTAVDAAGIHPPWTLFDVTKLEIRWVDGCVEISFRSNTIEMNQGARRPDGARR